MLFFVIGLSSWIILEYLLHRFYFHRGDNLLHNFHHENPKSLDDLFVNWRLVLFTSVVICGVALLFLSGLSVMLLYSGIAAGYFLYEFIHYRVHHCKPKTKIMKYLRKHHLRHHHKTEKGNYSVVFPPLDYLFNTIVDRSLRQ